MPRRRRRRDAEPARTRPASPLLDAAPPPERLIDLRSFRASSERAATFRGGAEGCRAGRARARRRPRRRAAAGAADALRGRVPGREGARVGARLRGPAAARARPARERRARPRARAAALPRDHGRRVPGHERAPVRARSTCSRPGRRTSSSSSATSSSRSTASGTPTSRSSASAARPRRSGSPLTQNYRSRPEVLAAVNHLFEPDFGDGFQPLAASGDFPDPVFGHPVELLVTDKASYAGTGVHWRRAEATHVARRVRELVDAGAASAGEIVLLFAAGTDAEWYEEELRARGPADRTARPVAATSASSRSSTSCLPAPAAEPLRRRGAASPSSPRRSSACRTTRSCCCGGTRRGGRCSPRSSARCRRGARRRATSSSCARSGSATSASSRRRRDCRSSGSSSGSSPTTTTTSPCSRAGTAAGATRTSASWRGSRAPTRSCAAPTSRGSSASSDQQESVGARELEAVAEEEGADAVRLLTIHAAKGLEFRVVIVADAGRDRAWRRRPTRSSRSRTAASGSRSPTPPRAGAAGPSPTTTCQAGGSGSATRERLRLYYVAMTRAIDRLIVSGALDWSGLATGDADRLGARAARLRRGARAAGAAPLELERDGARFVVRVDRFAPEPALRARAPAENVQLELFGSGLEIAAPPAAPRLPELVPIPAPPLHRVRRLSFTALALFEPCSYRYFAERVAGMRPREGAVERPPRSEGGLPRPRSATRHRLLELVDLRDAARRPSSSSSRPGTRP